MTALYDSPNYEAAAAGSRSRYSGNLIGGGYLPKHHQDVLRSAYGSASQLFKFRITDDVIAYKPQDSLGHFQVKFLIESEDDLSGIASQRHPRKKQEEV